VHGAAADGTAGFEDVADALAEALGAKRVLSDGSPHAVQRIGERFNDELLAHLNAAGGAVGRIWLSFGQEPASTATALSMPKSSFLRFLARLLIWVHTGDEDVGCRTYQDSSMRKSPSVMGENGAVFMQVTGRPLGCRSGVTKLPLPGGQDRPWHGPTGWRWPNTDMS
jgi:hypothetical protein